MVTSIDKKRYPREFECIQRSKNSWNPLCQKAEVYYLNYIWAVCDVKTESLYEYTHRLQGDQSTILNLAPADNRNGISVSPLPRTVIPGSTKRQVFGFRG